MRCFRRLPPWPTSPLVRPDKVLQIRLIVQRVVPIDDLRLLEELEDRIDLADARAALAEMKKKGAKSLETILKDLSF
ncbi:MAG: hypothetical protein OJF51_003692 [Nitrospira sp.]|nr:MAG: hypothetical protein OJF51_003692 [Nitrospira sp.]